VISANFGMRGPAWPSRVCFRLWSPAHVEEGRGELWLDLVVDQAPRERIAWAVMPLEVHAPQTARRVTFTSRVDGSIQPYALFPAARPPAEDAGSAPRGPPAPPPALAWGLVQDRWPLYDPH
jgi:hypothetical protein